MKLRWILGVVACAGCVALLVKSLGGEGAEPGDQDDSSVAFTSNGGTGAMPARAGSNSDEDIRISGSVDLTGSGVTASRSASPRAEAEHDVVDDGEVVPASFEVAFVPALGAQWPKDGNVVVLGACPDARAEVLRLPLDVTGRTTALLTEGEYRAAIVDAQEVQGQAVAFSVLDEALSVSLDGPSSFDWTWEVRDSDTEGVIEGAEISILRTDVLEHDAGPASVTTKADGRVRFDGCTSGTYVVDVRCQGYVARSTEYELPGVYLPWLVNGTLDMRWVYLHPEIDVAFRLEGAQDWGDPKDFSLTLEDDGVAHRFDDFGRTVMTLGDYKLPVVLFLDYPGGERAVHYLGAEFAGDDRENIIDVRKTRAVDVDVRMSSAAREQLSVGGVWVQATCSTSAVDSMQVNRRIYDEGVFSLEGPFGDVAMVSLTQVIDGRMMTLAAEEVVLDADGRAEVTLNVTEGPLWVKVLDGENRAAADAHLDVYTAPNRTDWIAGGDADAEGRIPVPRMKGDRILASCSTLAGLRAIDVPLRLDLPVSELQFLLEPSDRYWIEVTLDGEPALDARVLVYGAASRGKLDGAILDVESNGYTSPLRLARGSQAVFEPYVTTDAWPGELVAPLQPGANELRLFSVGSIESSRREALMAAVWGVDGSSVGDWVAAGRTSVEATDGALLSVAVPVGIYSATTPDGEPVDLVVSAGRESRLP